MTMAMSLAEILEQMPDAPDIADEEFESHEVDSVCGPPWVSVWSSFKRGA